MKPSIDLLTQADSVRYTLPAPYHPVLTVEDCNAIFQLFNGTTRAPHLCISKGQYKHLTEQLAARNHMLAKQLRAAQEHIRALQALLNEDDGK
jgi:hypothetical protein